MSCAAESAKHFLPGLAEEMHVNLSVRRLSHMLSFSSSLFRSGAFVDPISKKKKEGRQPGASPRPPCRKSTGVITRARELLSVGCGTETESSCRTGIRCTGGVPNAFGVHIANVEIDPETDKSRILRYTAIQDAGNAVHPSYVDGQMQIGTVQEIGWALNEEYFFDAKNQMRNASLSPKCPLSHRLPRLPMLFSARHSTILATPFSRRKSPGS